MFRRKKSSNMAVAKPEADGLARMAADEDMQAEAQSLEQAVAGLAISHGTVGGSTTTPTAPREVEHVPLNWQRGQGGHRSNAATLRLFREAGGHEAIKRFTTAFYVKAFADPVIDKFIREHDDPHGERFANWIAEKFGDGTPWSEERATRQTCPFQAHGHQLQTPHDRSSAHFAAWHSPKREPEKFGQHFKLDDCRIWMRLHFWAMREAGIIEASPAFAEYYVKFIAHFVSVYERTAPPFARESMRWSADPSNIERYVADCNQMLDVVGVSYRDAAAQLPREERDAHGDWPYC